MKVKELIEKLKEMPQEATVFGYSEPDEGDNYINEVEVCTVSDDGYMNEYGCQGDSYAAHYLTEYPEEKEVVVLMGSGIYIDRNKKMFYIN